MYILQTNCSSKEEAQKIGRSLVDLKLAACINYWQVDSIYRFDGKIAEDREWRLFVKTIKLKSEEVQRIIRSEHSYKNPVIWGNEVESDENTQNWLVANINNTNV